MTLRRSRPELKYRDENAPLSLMPSTPVTNLSGVNYWHVMDENISTNLTRIPQNTTATGRIGNAVIFRSLEFAVNVTAPRIAMKKSEGLGSLHANTECVFRVTIVVDRQYNNPLNFIQYSDVFYSSAGTDYTNSNITQIPRSVPNLRRFGILYDKIIQTSFDDRNKSVTGKIILNRRNRYDGPDADSLQSGAIYLLITCFAKWPVDEDYPVYDKTDVPPAVNWQSRLTFLDE